ncbi:LacI family DNA-binding transcriptional regulator [Streptomyces sp. CO7]
MSRRRPTMEDIARRAGVSKVAVSYALNDRPGVSPGTRAEIKRIAREIGWRPNSAARALTRARADAVGLVSSRPAQLLGAEPFFMGLISGMQDELAAQGKALTLQFVADAGQEMEVHRRWWGEGRIDGVLLTDLCTDDPRIALIRELGLPAVAIGHPEAAEGLPSVWSDDAAALGQTLRYLHALGHRSVARVAGLRDLDHTARRDRAHRAVCAELGMGEPAIVHTDYSGEAGARAARGLLIRPDRPTAIVFDNDIMAVAGLSVADELGLSVPGELSLVAWDDSQLTRVVRPGITALNRDIPAYGRHAVRTLLTLVEEGWAEGLEDEPARLLPRGSTGPAAGAAAAAAAARSGSVTAEPA